MTNFAIFTTLSTVIYFIIYYYNKEISKTLNVLDVPNENRKIHKTPTPKTGSYSIAITIFILLCSNFYFDIFNNELNILLIGVLLIFLVGLIDDKFNLSASKKIFLIILISFILCTYSEKLIVNKFYIYSLDFFFHLENFSILFTILCIFTLVNSLNLADGINGLATGLIFFWLIYINQIYENNLDLIIGVILINLTLSFIHNYSGKHFLGDAGSLMLSSFIAFLIIYLHNENIDLPNHTNSAENILIIFLVPILDMIRLFFERLLNKKNPSTADNNHLHHYLIYKYSKKRALLSYFIFVNTPILISLNSNINKFYIIGIVFLIYFLFVYYYKKSKKYEKKI
jgi:UDP-GlcNAc:undecaprenyl-phosphate/decaprenyl-phosphate GlcNAc-1-phosphate transferase